jgi:hypothetical protein
MASAEQATQIYRQLAEDYGRQGQAQMRDRFLVLAADAALAAGQQDEAERLRGRLLQHNPHHLLKPYSSFAEAMKSADVQKYVSALRRNHPYEKAESLLEGVRQSGERPTPPPSSGLPKTDPMVDLGARKQTLEAGEELKVFRVADTGQEPKATPARPTSSVKPLPASGPSPLPRPVLPSQPSQAPPSSRASGAAEILPLRREPYPALDKLRRSVMDTEEHDPNTTTWVSTALFVVALVVSIFLGIYTLLRPFLPQGLF